jgi:hypothetical protein
MGRKKLPTHKELKHVVCTRVGAKKYQELKNISSYPPHYGMSDLLRSILENRRIKIFISDPALDPVIEELKVIREKIKQTGIIINQQTKAFNSHGAFLQKEFYAKLAFIQYASLSKQFDRLLEIVGTLANRWLAENSAETVK